MVEGQRDDDDVETSTEDATKTPSKAVVEERERDDDLTDTSTEDAKNAPRGTTVTGFPTRVRETISPYLPPPVVHAISNLDPMLEPYVGPEATVTITGSMLAAWIVLSFIRLLFLSRGSSGGRAIAAEDEDHDVLSKSATAAATADEYGATVLLCGPTSGGKTRLFYQLCFDDYRPLTVMSIKANVAVSLVPEKDNELEKPIRYMDWPGHAQLSDEVLKPVLKERPRIILVLDSTQPVAAAADCLYQLLVYYYKEKNQRKGASDNEGEIAIFVACHKKDFPKAKNWRRIKIQMRTELERLLKARGKTAANTNDLWWPAGKPLDLNELGFCRLIFCSTTCEGRGSTELVQFCTTGILPEEKSR